MCKRGLQDNVGCGTTLIIDGKAIKSQPGAAGLPETGSAGKRTKPVAPTGSAAIDEQFELKMPKRVELESRPKAVDMRQEFGSFGCSVSGSGERSCGRFF